MHKTLWYYYTDGEWNSGSRTIPDVDKYTFFVITVQGGATPMFGYKLPAAAGGYIVRGVGSYDNGSTHTSYSCTFTCHNDDGVWTLVGCSYFAHTPGGSHTTRNNPGVGRIIGIL